MLTLTVLRHAERLLQAEEEFFQRHSRGSEPRDLKFLVLWELSGNSDEWQGQIAGVISTQQTGLREIY